MLLRTAVVPCYVSVTLMSVADTTVTLMVVYNMSVILMSVAEATVILMGVYNMPVILMVSPVVKSCVGMMAVVYGLAEVAVVGTVNTVVAALVTYKHRGTGTVEMAAVGIDRIDVEHPAADMPADGAVEVG